MYSTHNERKLVVAERLTRTLKNENYKHLAVVLKNMYTDKLDDIFNKYYNIYHRIIKFKMKLTDVNQSSYTDLGV